MPYWRERGLVTDEWHPVAQKWRSVPLIARLTPHGFHRWWCVGAVMSGW